jgi:hypothetical protein
MFQLYEAQCYFDSSRCGGVDIIAVNLFLSGIALPAAGADRG